MRWSCAGLGLGGGVLFRRWPLDPAAVAVALGRTRRKKGRLRNDTTDTETAFYWFLSRQKHAIPRDFSLGGNCSQRSNQHLSLSFHSILNDQTNIFPSHFTPPHSQRSNQHLSLSVHSILNDQINTFPSHSTPLSTIKSTFCWNLCVDQTSGRFQ